MFAIDSLHYIYIVSSTNIICLSIYIFVYVPGSVVNWVPPLLGQVQSVLDENVNLYQTYQGLDAIGSSCRHWRYFLNFMATFWVP